MGLGLDEAEGDLSNLRKNTNLEAIPKPRLRPNICVTRRLSMLTYFRCMLGFFVASSRDLEPDLRF